MTMQGERYAYLVVEDERALCDAIARSLRNLAYSVDWVATTGSRRSTCLMSTFDLVA